jgi:hypothetical protein
MAAAPDEHTNKYAMPPFADILNDFIARHRKSSAALSRKLNITENGLLAIRKKKTVQMELLWKLSEVYRHNFIADIAAKLPPGYTGALQDALAEKDREIAALQNELAAMAKERDIYKDLLKQ